MPGDCQVICSSMVGKNRRSPASTETPDLVTIAFLNTKIGEVENKIPDHAKYIVTIESDKFASSIFDKNKNKLSSKQ